MGRLGLDVSVQGLPRPQQSEIVWYDRETWDPTMWQMLGRPGRSDPDASVFSLSCRPTAANGFNVVGDNDPEQDKLAEPQRLTPDRDARKALVKQAHEIIDADQPYAFLVYPTKLHAYDSTVFRAVAAADRPGLGVKNIRSFLQIEPIGAQRDLILNSSDEINAIAPFYISGAADSRVTALIWDRLMRIGPDGLPRPWAAETVSWSDAGLSVTVALRDGMSWHDGKPVTVEDVIFGCEAPAQGTNAPMYKPFVTVIDRMEALDDRTVRFTPEEPNADFETSALARLNIAPRHVREPLLANLKEGETAEAIIEEAGHTPMSGRLHFAAFLDGATTVEQQEALVLFPRLRDRRRCCFGRASSAWTTSPVAAGCGRWRACPSTSRREPWSASPAAARPPPCAPSRASCRPRRGSAAARPFSRGATC